MFVKNPCLPRTSSPLAFSGQSKNNMKTTLQISLATVAALTFAANAGAWSDGFEAYAVGSNINGQGGWEGWTGIAAVGGTISAAQAASGTQSLQIVRGNDTVQRFSGVSSGYWELTLKQYIPSTSSGDTWVILMNSYPANLDWTANVNASRTSNLVTSGETAGASLPLQLDKWVEYKFAINLDALTLTTYYDGQLLDTHPWRDATGLNQLQALDLYADEDTAGGTAQVGPVYYDDVMLVPEPTSLSLLVLGGLALAFRRKLA